MTIAHALAGIFSSRRHRRTVAALYLLAVDRARAPVFYASLSVPDTVEGRFELIALHVHLLCRRLAADEAEGGPLAQAIFDHMFADMDRNLRELGTGDLVVGKRIKRMAHEYYGRAGAVEEGLLSDDPGVLAAAVGRNLLSAPAAAEAETVAADAPPLDAASAGQAGADPAVRIAAYIRQAVDALAGRSFADLVAARTGADLYGPAPPAADGMDNG